MISSSYLLNYSKGYVCFSLMFFIEVLPHLWIDRNFSSSMRKKTSTKSIIWYRSTSNRNGISLSLDKYLEKHGGRERESIDASDCSLPSSISVISSCCCHFSHDGNSQTDISLSLIMKKIISAKVMSIVFAFVRFSSASRLKDIAQSDYFDWFKCLFVRSFSSTVGVAVRLLRRLAVKIQISSTCVGGSNPPENTPNSAIQRTYIHEKKKTQNFFLVRNDHSSICSHQKPIIINSKKEIYFEIDQNSPPLMIQSISMYYNRSHSKGENNLSSFLRDFLFSLFV